MSRPGLRAGDRIAAIGFVVIALLFAVIFNAQELLALISQLQGGAS